MFITEGSKLKAEESKFSTFLTSSKKEKAKCGLSKRDHSTKKNIAMALFLFSSEVLVLLTQNM